MTNAILTSLIARLEKVEYTHNYIFGFAANGLIYFYETTRLVTGIKLDKASSKNGGGYSLRYKPTKEEKTTLVNSGICQVLCTVEFFLELVESTKYNKGEIFEKLVTEKFGLEWYKDNVRLDKGADIEYEKGVYSVKFEKATITTERTLANIESGK